MKYKYSDKYITLYGRKPVLEALVNKDLEVVKLFVSHKAKGNVIDQIIHSAQMRNIPLERTTAEKVKRIAGNGRQDQGVALDVLPKKMDTLDAYLQEIDQAGKIRLIAIDGITTPANIGLIVRSSVAAGIDGIVFPRKGSPNISPLIIKASAGLIFKSSILKCDTIEKGLRSLKDFGFKIYGLSGEATMSLFELHIPDLAVFVLGNESEGIGSGTAKLSDQLLRIPMANEVESLNVACAATLVSYECFKNKYLSSSRFS